MNNKSKSQDLNDSVQNRDVMYQVSLLQGLLNGDYCGSITVEELKQHMRPRYELADGVILKNYVEYSGNELIAYREKMIERLQNVFKQYEQKYLNSSDITMASTLAVMRKPKGTAVTVWLSLFWQAYFAEKTKIETAEYAADFAAVQFRPDLQGVPPHTMRELSAESAELYAEISAESNGV